MMTEIVFVIVGVTEGVGGAGGGVGGGDGGCFDKKYKIINNPKITRKKSFTFGCSGRNLIFSNNHLKRHSTKIVRNKTPISYIIYP